MASPRILCARLRLPIFAVYLALFPSGTSLASNLREWSRRAVWASVNVKRHAECRSQFIQARPRLHLLGFLFCWSEM